MSARHSSGRCHSLASLSALRYSTYDVDAEAIDCESDGLDLVGGLHVHICSDGTHAGVRRRALSGGCSSGRVGGGRGGVQRVVIHDACHDPSGVKRILVGGGSLVGRGTSLYVCDRRQDLVGAPGGGRFCHGRFREHQRCGDSPLGMA